MRRASQPSAVLAAAVLIVACNGSIIPPHVVPTPTPVVTPAPSVTPSPEVIPTPVPTPAPITYRVRQGDTLGRIATRFKRTIGQLVTANTDITDPNHIEIGQLIMIPPADAPDIPPSLAVVHDPTDDLVDDQGFQTTGPGYADLSGFAIRLGNPVLLMELQLIAAPPNVDPSVEAISYVINIDTTGDGEPDYTVTYANNLPGQTGYAAQLRNRSTGEELTGADFLGTVDVTRSSIKISVSLAALGASSGTGSFAAAASAERTFQPDGPGDSSAERSFDLAPDQQWPRTNARWVTVST